MKDPVVVADVNVVGVAFYVNVNIDVAVAVYIFDADVVGVVDTNY